MGSRRTTEGARVCLGVPGQVRSFVEETDQLASVEVAGVTRKVNVGLVREEGLEVGDWVLIHVGFAMAIIDEEEANEALAGLRMLGQVFDDEVDEITRSRIE